MRLTNQPKFVSCKMTFPHFSIPQIIPHSASFFRIPHSAKYPWSTFRIPHSANFLAPIPTCQSFPGSQHFLSLSELLGLLQHYSRDFLQTVICSAATKYILRIYVLRGVGPIELIVSVVTRLKTLNEMTMKIRVLSRDILPPICLQNQFMFTTVAIRYFILCRPYLVKF